MNYQPPLGDGCTCPLFAQSDKVLRTHLD